MATKEYKCTVIEVKEIRMSSLAEPTFDLESGNKHDTRAPVGSIEKYFGCLCALCNLYG